ncbi:MAG TPA: S41 family peptidase [Candidatus Sericytochromatia bacterium]
MKRKLVVRTTVMTLTAVATVGTDNYLSQNWVHSQPSPPPVAAESAKQLVDEVWQIVNRQYVDARFNGQDWNAVRQQYLNRSYASKEEAYKAILEMLEPLGDPFTRFMNPQDFRKVQMQTGGESIGVGVQLILDKKTKELVVATPIEEAPAYTAGILPGDVLIKIDGQSTQGLHPYDANIRTQGEEGTIVLLTVRRGQKELEFKIPRKRMESRIVRYRSQKTPAGDMGYIRLTLFGANATQEMRNAIKDLERQQVAGYILDLRTNPGGLLFSIIEIARMWMQEGTIVSTFNRQGEVDRQIANRRALTDKPLIILVNEATASGSEILAGALQDNQRVLLMGTQTLGYNSIQSVRGLTDGSGLAVTIAKWRTPKQRDIGSSGITPDVVVTLTLAQQQAMIRERSAGTMADPQYAKAVEKLTQLIKK